MNKRIILTEEELDTILESEKTAPALAEEMGLSAWFIRETRKANGQSRPRGRPRKKEVVA